MVGSFASKCYGQHIHTKHIMSSTIVNKLIWCIILNKFKCVLYYSIFQQQQQQQQQSVNVPDPKLGSSRPISTAWNDVSGVTTAMGLQTVGPPGPANERPRPPSRGLHSLEDFQKLGLYSEESSPPLPVACSGSLGPIGPPSRYKFCCFSFFSLFIFIYFYF